MRTFFAPAHVWVHTLFQVHSLDTISELSVLSTGSDPIFSNFFSRFQGIGQPPFCPLNLDENLAMRESLSPRTPSRRLSRLSEASQNSQRMEFTALVPPNEAVETVNATPDMHTSANGATKLFPGYRNAINAALQSMNESTLTNEDPVPPDLTMVQPSVPRQETTGVQAGRTRRLSINHQIPENLHRHNTWEAADREVEQLPLPPIMVQGNDRAGPFESEMGLFFLEQLNVNRAEFSEDLVDMEQALQASNQDQRGSRG